MTSSARASIPSSSRTPYACSSPSVNVRAESSNVVASDPKTIRYLASKGFADETVAAVADFGVVASGRADELG